MSSSVDNSEKGIWDYDLSFVPETCFDSDSDLSLSDFKQFLANDEATAFKKVVGSQSSVKDDVSSLVVLDSYDSSRISELAGEDEVNSPPPRRKWQKKRHPRLIPIPPKRQHQEKEEKKEKTMLQKMFDFVEFLEKKSS